MSASIRRSERAMKLMAYADGELESAERAEVEAWLAEDAEAVLFANDLAELGDLLKIGHKTPDFDVADDVMAKIAKGNSDTEIPVEKPNVVPLKRPVAAPAQRKRSTVGWILGGLALAASIFLVARHKDDEAPLAQTTSPLVQPGQAVAAAASAGTVDVENPGRSVSVIYVPDEKSAVPNVTTVVWVDESAGGK
jgi:anti-sigma factor RsiW